MSETGRFLQWVWVGSLTFFPILGFWQGKYLCIFGNWQRLSENLGLLEKCECILTLSAVRRWELGSWKGEILNRNLMEPTKNFKIFGTRTSKIYMDEHWFVKEAWKTLWIGKKSQWPRWVRIQQNIANRLPIILCRCKLKFKTMSSCMPVIVFTVKCAWLSFILLQQYREKTGTWKN